MQRTMARLQDEYAKTIRPALQKTLGLKNVHMSPCAEKVVLNIGFGKNLKDSAFRESCTKTLERITGQKPVLTKARKSISNFKIREGQVVGIRVTLRGRRMYEFIDKLVNITLPRVRDFRGLDPQQFDGRGNYAIGFSEHVVFPEISPDEVERLHGLEVAIVTSAKDDRSGFELLKLLGFPFAE